MDAKNGIFFCCLDCGGAWDKVDSSVEDMQSLEDIVPNGSRLTQLNELDEHNLDYEFVEVSETVLKLVMGIPSEQ